ncbi:hypothetical protein [Williamsia phyllosphaerae]|uniref:DUF2946 domain-containing protein n=1 Tax=Williamsia phyllosphaerae TaxID=885042 RepID=A0ABQ1UBZ2_9NOCA|nr:hypothetical protein [Williamsia phyllosphaerae]GGF13363.1 hypothetical protein GCM10007298_06680 [Williamsia phyllosphaerae]
MITGRYRQPRPNAAVSGLLALSVAVMHIVMVACLSGGSVTATASPDPHAVHSATMSAAMGSATEHAAASADCLMGDHACVFVRADAVFLTVAVGLVLATAPLAIAAVIRLARRGERLGRSPPWAIPDHLELSVIRR